MTAGGASGASCGRRRRRTRRRPPAWPAGTRARRPGPGSAPPWRARRPGSRRPGVDAGHGLGQGRGVEGRERCPAKRVVCPARSCLFRLRSAETTFLSSPSRGWKASSGTPAAKQRRRGPQQAVAAEDAVVEEGEGLAGLEGLHPQAHLAELDRHGVEVDPVEAVADDVAQRRRAGPRGRAPRRRCAAAASRLARRWAAATRK